MTITSDQSALFAGWGNRIPRLCQDGLFEEDAFLRASISVAFVVNQPNPEGVTNLRSAIAEGMVGHPYTTVAHFANAVRLLPNHAKIFRDSNLEPKDISTAFESVALVNHFKGPGFWREGIGIGEQKSHPFSTMLIEQIQLYSPKLIICFAVEPFSVLIGGLGPCQWRDPIEEDGDRQYICWMTKENQAIVNYGYFQDSDTRIPLMYHEFLRLLEWASQ